MFALKSEAEIIRRTARISDCGAYRYTLGRWWGPEDGGRLLFIMLNPSTADGREDDNTVRRCIGYARDWGFDGFDVVNLFALRSTDPRELRLAPDPIGPDNDAWIISHAAVADWIVCAWGALGCLNGRASAVLDLLDGFRDRLWCLKKTRHGYPHHPLRLPAILDPIPFARRRRAAG